MMTGRAETGTRDTINKMAGVSNPQTLKFIQEELEDAKRNILEKVEGSDVISCHPAAVNVRITRTRYKCVVVLMQFSDNYPDDPILSELKSKTLPPALLSKLMDVCDQEIKKFLGRRQVLSVLMFVRKFLDDNPLIVCSDELQHIKKRLLDSDRDQLKVKQKAGVLNIGIRQNRYSFDVKMTLPDNYPAEAVCVELKESNFPDNLCNVFIGQAVDMTRQCVEPPIRRKPRDPPFEPKPSLRIACEFLVTDCVRRYPLETCAICHEKALPDDPNDIVTDPNDYKFVERVYCAHLFHFGCLDKYLKTPPFQGGKLCPACRKRIYHDRWKITPRLAEDRWSHQEAKKRELSEVVDFLGDL